jgi:hypothetical protein
MDLAGTVALVTGGGTDVRAEIDQSLMARVTVDEVAAAAPSLLATDAITGGVLVVDRGERWHPEHG